MKVMNVKYKAPIEVKLGEKNSQNKLGARAEVAVPSLLYSPECTTVERA